MIEIPNELAKKAIEQHELQMERILGGSNAYSQLEEVFDRQDAIAAIRSEYVVINEEDEAA